MQHSLWLPATDTAQVTAALHGSLPDGIVAIEEAEAGLRLNLVGSDYGPTHVIFEKIMGTLRRAQIQVDPVMSDPGEDAAGDRTPRRIIGLMVPLATAAAAA